MSRGSIAELLRRRVQPSHLLLAFRGGILQGMCALDFPRIGLTLEFQLFQTDSLPLEVSADLIFCVSPSSCKSSQVVVQRRAASCWLDAVDFLSLSCSLNTDLSIRRGFGGGDGDGGRRAAKTFSRSIGGATLKHIRYGAIAFAFPFVKVVLPLFQDLAAF